MEVAVGIRLAFGHASAERWEAGTQVLGCPLGWPGRGAWRSLVSALVWGVGARFPAMPLGSPKRLEGGVFAHRGSPRFPQTPR